MTDPNTAPVVPAMDVETRAQQMFEAYGGRWDGLPTDQRAPYRERARFELAWEAKRRGEHQVMTELQGTYTTGSPGGVPRSLAKADAFSRETAPFAAAVHELCELADMVEDSGGRYVWDHLSEIELDQYAAKVRGAVQAVRGFLDLVASPVVR